PSGNVPATVREATLARALRLTPEARALLDFCAVVPNRVERWLVDGADLASATAIDECAATGLMIDAGETLMFRHELARQAIESALPPVSLRKLNAAVFRRLLDRAEGVTTVRLVHHAARAGDDAAVRLYAPEAACQASALGAHREAAAHYQMTLDHTPAGEIDARAKFSE